MDDDDRAGRVLVCDDDEDFAESLALVIGDSGCAVDVVHSGEDAVEYCARARPELAFLDVKLPGIDGVEALSRIRRANDRVRVVMMTGYTDTAAQQRARRLGAERVLFKPLDMDEVVALVQPG